MPTSNPRKTSTDQPISKPEVDGKYAATTWGSGGIGEMKDLEVPSGQLCLVRRPGVQGLIGAGVLHNIDSLTALVDSKHLKKSGKKGTGSKKEPELDMDSLLKDPVALENVMHTVDRVVVHCVVKPELQMTPNDVTRRQNGVIYADMVDLVDKMFIFQYAVGGSAELEPFRRGLAEAVGSVDGLEGVGSSTE